MGIPTSKALPSQATDAASNDVPAEHAPILPEKDLPDTPEAPGMPEDLPILSPPMFPALSMLSATDAAEVELPDIPSVELPDIFVI